MPIDDFLWRALVAGLGVAAAAGPLGCFVVWQRMVYFGASVAHAALLGVALGMFLDVEPLAAILAICAIFAIAVALVPAHSPLANDTLLGIFAHAALAAGIVAIGLTGGTGKDLMGYLFGDILAVGRAELAWVLGGGAAILAGLAAIWKRLLALTVHEELARAEGVPVPFVRLVFMLLLATAVALGMKVAGVLLVVSLLVIPAAAARPFVHTPEGMAGVATAFGGLAVIVGLFASLHWDIPAGPAIVLAAFVLFAVGAAVGRFGGGAS